MKLDFVAEKIVPGYSGINSSPFLPCARWQGFRLGTEHVLRQSVPLAFSYTKMDGFGFIDFLCFCSFSSWLWGSLARKKDGEKLDCGLNARKGMPARLVFVKMCTSPQRRRETGCFALLWQDTKQEKWPKQIKPHTNFNQGLYSLSQVKSLTNVWVWVAVKPLR